MNEHDYFRCQLAETIQAWLGVELEIYLLYAAIMEGANAHLVSATFTHIESFDSKIALLNSCLALCFNKESNEWKRWKNLYNQAQKLNKKRNKIVHEPIILSVKDGVESIAISPSHFNALVVAKGQTTFNGPIIGPDYKPSSAKLLDDHRVDFLGLLDIEKSFKELAKKIGEYRTVATQILGPILKNDSLVGCARRTIKKVER